MHRIVLNLPSTNSWDMGKCKTLCASRSERRRAKRSQLYNKQHDLCISGAKHGRNTAQSAGRKGFHAGMGGSMLCVEAVGEGRAHDAEFMMNRNIMCGYDKRSMLASKLSFFVCQPLDAIAYIIHIVTFKRAQTFCAYYSLSSPSSS